MLKKYGEFDRALECAAQQRHLLRLPQAPAPARAPAPAEAEAEAPDCIAGSKLLARLFNLRKLWLLTRSRFLPRVMAARRE